MKTKLVLTIACLVILSACNQKTTNDGEVQVGDFTTIQLQENIYDKNVMAVVTLTDQLINPELWIDGVQVGTFADNVCSFVPTKFGDVDCEIRHASGVKTDGLKMYIETSFIQYNSSGENGDKKDPIEDGEVILTPSNVTLGSSDMIWAYDVRVPKGKSITFDYITSLLPDTLPNYGNNKLELHFRIDDYKDRVLLYPDEPYYAKYIDAEVEKWIDSPATLEHGVYTVFACPNFRSDKNRVSVIHSSDFSNGKFTANYKSLAVWPND